MPKRGTVKWFSVQHEEFVAHARHGVRTASSGAVAGDEGDVRTADELIECKMTGNPAKPLKKKPTIVSQFEKIADEAYMDGRTPAMALRYFCPASPLADDDGWVDLYVRRLVDA